LSVSRKSKLNFEVDVVQMEVTQPAAKMLVELSKSQDIVAGDGTTTGQTLHFELQATYLCI
jgi:chaperonin GroEL (HSP60 family)